MLCKESLKTTDTCCNGDCFNNTVNIYLSNTVLNSEKNWYGKLQSMMIHCYFAFLWKELTFQLDANLGSFHEEKKQGLFCCFCLQIFVSFMCQEEIPLQYSDSANAGEMRFSSSRLVTLTRSARHGQL